MNAQVTQDHLKAIRVRTEADLEALNLTRQVEKSEGRPRVVRGGPDARKGDRRGTARRFRS